ncbi:hypothetical protein GCM10010123_38130 [Pilimelia anulata]|uniref:Secreted protein n=1 Tax=Pilimelia anulata TaxID=53371 RepID=A0A8J3BAB0_9ACTN|nr:hypothetical protein [Pilimelia anulata]GGK04557.1 hypothetical protein GCM10010123_38130 [Pilimelia anulata]
MRSLTARILAAALAVPAICAGSAAPALAGGAAPVVDPAGDVVDMATGEPVDKPEADLVAADGRRVGDDLVLSFRTAKPTDPQTDPAWEDLAAAPMELNTDDSEEIEYLVYYGTYNGADGLVARVFRDEKDGTLTPLCDGTGAYGDGTHTIAFPLSCIDNPAEIGYRTGLYYPRDDSDAAPLTLDLAPDDGYAKVD